jgi:hypothetical protein
MSFLKDFHHKVDQARKAQWATGLYWDHKIVGSPLATPLTERKRSDAAADLFSIGDAQARTLHLSFPICVHLRSSAVTSSFLS